MLSFIFIIAFVLCFAIAVLCVLICYELINTYNAAFYRFYFYYLIAFLVFAIYAFWGQIGMQALLNSIATTTEVEKVVTGFVPLLGLPFFIIALIMLPKMAFALVNRPMRQKAHYFHLIVGLAIGVIFIGRYHTGSSIRSFTEAPIFPLIVLMATELMYLLFFTGIAMRHRNKTEPLKRKTIDRFVVLLFVGLLFRASSLAFHEVEAWALPFLVLVYFLSHGPALWYVRQQSPMLFEPVGAERPNADKKTFLYKKYQITPREQEVIEQICLGKTNQQIADTLFISLQTVKDHTHRIYTKVGINSRMKLVRLLTN